MLGKIQAVIEREGLIPLGSKIVVGVSGGADSVALLHILHRLGYNLVVAHLNHCIRGAEADADEAFVKDLCASLGVECVTQKTDVPALAKEKGISLEMAARHARHEFFRSQVEGQKSKVVIALAHHADDQLETFFLRAARGSGPSGLSGMKSFQRLENVDATPSSRQQCSENATRASRLHLIRPLLSVRRSEIFQWLEKEGLEWREDASNTDETIPRNLVRHQILPILGKINDRAAENILRTMEILRDEEDRPEKAARRREARDRLIEYGVNPTFDAIEKFVEFAEKKNGTRFLDLAGVRLINEYGSVNVDATPSSRFLHSANATGASRLHSIRMEEGAGILRGPWTASVSLAKIAGREVTVRAAEPGERMEPYGMEGSKKLQDIFTDLKIPKAQRAAWPVVVCGGEIIWIPGYRIARGWELVSDSDPALHLFASNVD
ncbi:MAG: tRNA lysidine(34) synthetase TilS [Verrucomicrobia bacterium]|nr:tRNA lysidine(34) synthetase TilS [Verrucomicrobiota bacterium]